MTLDEPDDLVVDEAAVGDDHELGVGEAPLELGHEALQLGEIEEGLAAQNSMRAGAPVSHSSRRRRKTSASAVLVTVAASISLDWPQ